MDGVVVTRCVHWMELNDGNVKVEIIAYYNFR